MDKVDWECIPQRVIYANKQKLCSECFYASFVTDSENVSTMTCDYILTEGHSRGCCPINCKKFRSADEKRKKRSIRLRSGRKKTFLGGDTIGQIRFKRIHRRL